MAGKRWTVRLILWFGVNGAKGRLINQTVQANRDRTRWQNGPRAPFWVAFMLTVHTVTAIVTDTAEE